MEPKKNPNLDFSKDRMLLRVQQEQKSSLVNQGVNVIYLE